MKRFDFSRGRWDRAQLPMTYAPMCRHYSDIRQEDDCIANGMNAHIGDYDYIGVAMTEPTRGDASITARCSFESYGAPLIVLADDVCTDPDGRRLYGAIYEVVAWEGGCNVWRILPVPDPERPDRAYTVRNITRESFPVAGGTVIDMAVRVRGKRLFVTVNDYAFDVAVPELPDAYFVGVTLCEGVNRFYELCVDSEENLR